jgi:hypothetical protein
MVESDWEKRQAAMKEAAKKARQAAAKGEREKIRAAKKQYRQGEVVEESLARRFAAEEKRKKSQRDLAKEKRAEIKNRKRPSKNPGLGKGFQDASSETMAQAQPPARLNVEELRALIRVITNPTSTS